ncbi:metallophosphoesterase family protein [Amphritea sp. 1_MG-2023]|uniref:metallophosphoesterase family protein n=1 Tax=Amphritea sp. 1_MG-2023 TaxID=3062670 RepID=UPI0026E2F461|nr:metallophosphoesterase family protein [Amphritea sp. 1_MG-2023]MDO6565088.1 metallophosphoesterase family protein [Amphritea sp. 1_MG-2023]
MTQFQPDASAPLLVFGGPYSNLQATQAIKQLAEQQQIPADNIICTGDLVAYCAQPDATVDLIREWGISVIAGNCEESIGYGASDCGCGFSAGSACDLLSVAWYNYSVSRVSDSNKAWMRQLPNQLDFDYGGEAFSAIHAGLDSNNQFIFASTSVTEKQQPATRRVILSGHSGIPFGQQTEQGYWLNAGVIGMPANDATAQTWYLLIHTEEQQLVCRWHRLDYDHHQAAQQMASAGLNNGYQQTLSTGLWPSLDVLPAQEKARTGNALSLAPLVIPQN